jgi:putative FmdB family regulatory protein
MPIYAYRCDECGFAKDVLQKISDPVLTVCPTCGKSSFKKQVTAAGFQLKGTGWYVTDFRGGSAPATGTAPASDGGAGAGSSTSTSAGSDSGSAAAPAPAASTASSGDA